MFIFLGRMRDARCQLVFQVEGREHGCCRCKPYNAGVTEEEFLGPGKTFSFSSLVPSLSVIQRHVWGPRATWPTNAPARCGLCPLHLWNLEPSKQRGTPELDSSLQEGAYPRRSACCCAASGQFRSAHPPLETAAVVSPGSCRQRAKT